MESSPGGSVTNGATPSSNVCNNQGKGLYFLNPICLNGKKLSGTGRRANLALPLRAFVKYRFLLNTQHILYFMETLTQVECNGEM